MSRRGNTRPAVERIVRLARLLRYGLPFTSHEVVSEFCVGRKTISRDLVFMRERLGWDIAWNQSRKTYELKSPPPAPSL